jgi:integrase
VTDPLRIKRLGVRIPPSAPPLTSGNADFTLQLGSGVVLLHGARTRRRQRSRGTIEELPSGSLRVSVYAGVDPLTKRRIYLKETVAAGPKAQAEVERALTRLPNRVDEKRHPRTSATVNQLLDRHLEVAEIDGSTRSSYRSVMRKHIRPLLGELKVGGVAGDAGVEILESFYAELRRCRDHCTASPTSSTGRRKTTT